MMQSQYQPIVVVIFVDSKHINLLFSCHHLLIKDVLLIFVMDYLKVLPTTFYSITKLQHCHLFTQLILQLMSLSFALRILLYLVLATPWLDCLPGSSIQLRQYFRILFSNKLLLSLMQEEQLFEKKVRYNDQKYHETRSKNLICKHCLIKNSDHIQIFDHVILMDRLILRADLSKIYIGRYVTLSQNVIVKPPIKKQNNQMKFVPVQIGNYVFVDKNTIIQAMKVGNYVKIGKDCVIGQRVVIGECSIILDGSIVTADTQIAPFSVYGGKPALYMGQLPESAPIVQKQMCVNYFNNFCREQTAASTSSSTARSSNQTPKQPPKQPTQTNKQ